MSNKNNRDWDEVFDDSSNEDRINHSENSGIGFILSIIFLPIIAEAGAHIKPKIEGYLSKVISPPSESSQKNDRTNLPPSIRYSPPPTPEPNPLLPPSGNDARRRREEEIQAVVNRSAVGHSVSLLFEDAIDEYDKLVPLVIKDARQANHKQGNLFSDPDIRIIAESAARSALHLNDVANKSAVRHLGSAFSDMDFETLVSLVVEDAREENHKQRNLFSDSDVRIIAESAARLALQ